MADIMNSSNGFSKTDLFDTWLFTVSMHRESDGRMPKEVMEDVTHDVFGIVNHNLVSLLISDMLHYHVMNGNVTNKKGFYFIA